MFFKIKTSPIAQADLKLNMSKDDFELTFLPLPPQC